MERAPPPAAPPAKKKRSGFVTLLWFIGIGLLLFVIAGGVVAWKIASNPEARGVAGAAWEGIGMISSAQSAPGMKELRKAGCSQAMALPMGEVARVMRKLDAGLDREMPFTVVTCTTGLLGKTLECDALARVYAAAVPHGPPFVLSAQRTGSTKSVCQGTYRGDATKIDITQVDDDPGRVYMPDGDEDDEDDEPYEPDDAGAARD